MICCYFVKSIHYFYAQLEARRQSYDEGFIESPAAVGGGCFSTVVVYKERCMDWIIYTFVTLNEKKRKN